jgi:hypothetical protein
MSSPPFGIAQGALLRFGAAPVEGDGGGIEELQKRLPVGLLFFLHLTDYKKIGAEKKLLRLLRHLHFRPGHRLA